MRAKTKKWFSPLFVLTLAIAGIFGVSAAVVNKQAEETPAVEKADATAQNEYIYARANPDNSFGALTKVHMWGSSGDYAAWDNDPTMTRIGSTNTYYLQLSAKNPSQYANSGVIFRSSSNQTGNITSNTPATKSVFNNFTKGGTSADFGTTDTWALATSQNNWSTSANRLTLSTTGTYSHRYYISYTFNAAGTFKIVNVTKNAWYQYVSGRGGIPNTIVDDGTNDHNFSVSTPGTLVIWMTPIANAYDNATYIYDGTEGAMTFTPASKTITYEYKTTDGGNARSSTSTTANVGSSVTLPNTSVSGYNFYGWWSTYSTGVFSDFVGNGGASYTVPNSDPTLYGRYVANGKAYILGSFNSWNPTSSYAMTKDSPSSGYYKFTKTFAADEEFYIFYCNSSGSSYDGNYHWENVDDAGDGKGCFANSSTNVKCTIAGTFDIILDVVNGHIFIYHSPYVDTAGYYMAGTGSFGDWTITNGLLMSSDPSGSNTAILENGTTGISVAKDSRVQIINHEGVGTNTWYSMTLGGSYSFASEHTEGDGKKSIEFTKAGNYNFYFKIDNGTNYLYIVDVGEIANAGTLFISSPQGTIGNITVYTTNTKGDHQFNNVALTNVSGVEKKSSTLKFGNGYIYMIPLYNLRGNDAGSKCTSVTFSWTSPSSGSIALTSVDSLGGSAQLYYVDGSTASTDKYVGLKVALDIDAAITAASNHSVCNVDSAIAKALCDRYDAVTSAQGSSLLTSSTINTYTSTKPTYSGSADIPMSSIRYQLGRRTGISSYYSINSFKPYELIVGEDGVDASIILIIVASSISILSITALSVLMVKKKKSANK